MTTYQQTTRSIGKFTEFVGESKRQMIPLSSDEARSLRRHGQHVRVIEGIGWLTVDGRDYVLQPGDQALLGEGHIPAVVGSANHEPVLFEVIRS
ncbi:MAG: hypothetical protein KJ065_14005 [Anaerolineae bacterium]|nr:hypothetical protein [Anaerolineae bacterium]